MTSRREFISLVMGACAAAAIPASIAPDTGWTVIEDVAEPLYGEISERYVKALAASMRETLNTAFADVYADWPADQHRPITLADPHE